MRVLITSGGGAKGAFSVGVLNYLKNEKNITHFDMISGTSTGALIASLASVGMIDELKEVYLNTTNGNILEPLNLFDTVISGNNFIYNTHPLFEQISQHITNSTFDDIMNSGTTLCLNSVSLQTGRITVFTTGNILPSNHYETKKITDRNQLINALLASSNQAVFMNPIRIDGESYVDGGNREVIPTRAVCSNLDLNEAHEIYMLSNNPDELVKATDAKLNGVLKVLMRSISMFIQEVRENDLELMAKFKLLAAQPKNVKIFYLCPNGELDRDFPTGLRFDRGLMLQWMLEGEQLAAEIIETTDEGNFPAFHLSNRPFA
jgi:predicted acylesterase/phospholipase RssA